MIGYVVSETIVERNLNRATICAALPSRVDFCDRYISYSPGMTIYIHYPCEARAGYALRFSSNAKGSKLRHINCHSSVQSRKNMEKFPLFMLAYDALQAVNGMVGLDAVCYHQETN